MTKLSRLLIATLSSALEPELRESVVGDLTELRASYTKTAYELLGLILRQEARLWRTWRQWLALIGIVGAIGWLLSNVCLGLVGDVARQAFVYWQYGVPYNSGVTGAQEIEVVVCMSFAVACWSWLAGFTLAALSGKTALINKTLFCLVLRLWSSGTAGLFGASRSQCVGLRGTAPCCWFLSTGILRSGSSVISDTVFHDSVPTGNAAC